MRLTRNTSESFWSLPGKWHLYALLLAFEPVFILLVRPTPATTETMLAALFYGGVIGLMLGATVRNRFALIAMVLVILLRAAAGDFNTWSITDQFLYALMCGLNGVVLSTFLAGSSPFRRSTSAHRP